MSNLNWIQTVCRLSGGDLRKLTLTVKSLSFNSSDIIFVLCCIGENEQNIFKPNCLQELPCLLSVGLVVAGSM